MNKAGFMQDMLLYAVIVLIVGMVILISSNLLDSTNTKLQNTLDGSTGKNIIDNSNNRFSVTYDNIFLMIFMMVGIALIIGFFVLDTHPALFFGVVIITIFMLIVNGILSNTYDKYTDQDNIANEETKFTFMTWFMDYWIEFTVVFLFMGLIALFAKMRSG